MSKLFIITGSSGFIGSYITEKLIRDNNYVIGIDIEKCKIEYKYNEKYLHIIADLSDEDNNDNLIDIINIQINVWDIEFHNIYVFHLAAKISVEESMSNPPLYYKNNVSSTFNILEIMRNVGIKKIYFSSTAAVYDSTNIINGVFDIDAIIDSSSIYGHSKYLAERIINKYVKLFNFGAVIFRFFNVGGGKDSKEAHHLIPKLVSAIINNKNWYIYGNNYNTKDGTCIRDYIHVDDIYKAFLLSVESGMENIIFNLGSGSGYTVLDVIESCKNIITNLYTSYKIPQTVFSDRREGDPDVLVSDVCRTHVELGWYCEKKIEDIIIDTMNSYGMIMD